MQVSGKIYPNGEFGIARVKKFSPEPLPEASLTRKQELTIEYLPIIGIDGIKAVDASHASPVPLGLSLLPNSPIRVPRGSHGITREAARNVRNAAYLMQERYGRNRLTFATLTLPAVSQEESQLLSLDWHMIVKGLVKEIRRDLERHRLPPIVVGVTEIQPGRTGRDRVLGLHLHLLWVGRARFGSWAITTKRIDTLWQRQLEKSLNRPVMVSSACNLQVVRLSASGYLGKYMSKGAKTVSAVRETMPGIRLPSAWYTMSRTLLDWIRKRIVSDSEIIHSLWEDCWSETPALTSFKGFIEIEVSEGWSYVCGAFGRVKSEFLKWLKSEFSEYEGEWFSDRKKCPLTDVV